VVAVDRGKKNVIGILVDAVDYEAALQRIKVAASERRSLALSALAVHGVMTGYTDAEHRTRLNHLDLVVPDGQPVRWALNLVHRAKLIDRVYGPTLMIKVCDLAEREELGIYLYGSTPAVLENLKRSLRERFPKLKICGAEPSMFRCLSAEEKTRAVARIRSSGAQITFVGLGCPRQEVWAYEYRDELSMPILAVGAAFDFHGGKTRQAPQWMQDRGLEWLFRLRTEPRRLWRRYVLLNPWYLSLLAVQLLRLRQFSHSVNESPKMISYG
jgi:N-acetylglucosaminyldiphosphoundecaprenol N-acetyl-beta-D-mannosaminyltransferase